MKPPMRQFVDVSTPELDENGEVKTDRYGKPKMTKTTTKARVQRTTKVIQSPDGSTYESSLEVDLPPSIPVNYGTEVSYVDTFGHPSVGKVVAMQESTNLAGNKVYFRTVNVG